MQFQLSDSARSAPVLEQPEPGQDWHRVRDQALLEEKHLGLSQAGAPDQASDQSPEQELSAGFYSWEQTFLAT